MFCAQVGLKYESENEEDLKNKMDYMKIVETFPGLGPFVLCVHVCVCVSQ